ncbi:unnamed protein product [Angiostrongylus costaricensis]|uniref:Uncharacterized protein n=1 Tax=Angiostrongylus costaricensis TaxID=334426 RepID=A0A0R3Q2L9_ANGCS|nr:unnamed protein product [Angiostrongylus costaricensis]
MHKRLKVIVLLFGVLLLIGMFTQFLMPYQSLISYFFICFFSFGVLLLIGMFAQFLMPYQSLIAETKNLVPESECVCELDNIRHDFCYRLPAASDIRGTRFNCTYAAHLKMLETKNLVPESECVCELDNIRHDFCYRLPAASDIRGTRFNCTYAAHLKMLGNITTVITFF